jgi:hypothetical protein
MRRSSAADPLNANDRPNHFHCGRNAIGPSSEYVSVEHGFPRLLGAVNETSQDCQRRIDDGNVFLCSVDDSEVGSRSRHRSMRGSSHRLATNRFSVCGRARRPLPGRRWVAYPCVVLGCIRLPCIHHSFWCGRQLPRQSPTDYLGSVDVRTCVLACEASVAAEAASLVSAASFINSPSRLTAGGWQDF